MKFYDKLTGILLADSCVDPLSDFETTENDINSALSRYILSSSGWRSVFSPDGDEGRGEDVAGADRILAAAAAAAFFKYLGKEHPRIILGSDARPTGRILMDISARVLISLGAELSLLGISAAPEIMAYSNASFDGFYYISASHNPIGHNGFKFGFSGGVLPGDEAEKVKKIFLSMIDGSLAGKMKSLSSSFDVSLYESVLRSHDRVKDRALSYYAHFVEKTAHASSSSIIPFGVAIDFNGSARAASIDIPFLRRHGAALWCCNAVPGQIEHAIVPEGRNLDTARRLLDTAHASDPSFVIGYMPDNDGDRGNLVYTDRRGKAHDISAQDVFALVSVIELAHAVAEGHHKVAVAANGPTSILIDDIARRLGVSVFRSDIGEANVVSLAASLRRKGYYVPLCGEGSNGGCIVHPAKVRDPMNSIMTVAKLWSVPGLYDTIMKALGKKGGEPSIHALLVALPRYMMTPAFSPDAVIRIKSTDFDALKDEYEKILFSEIGEHMPAGAYGYEVRQYEASREERGAGCAHRCRPSTGGYRVLFLGADGFPVAALWLSRSRTEPVVRIMADTGPGMTGCHDSLLAWQRSMVGRSDAALVP